MKNENGTLELEETKVASIVKVEAAEFGLDEQKVSAIAEKFIPVINIMTEYEAEFQEVIKLDINEPATAVKASALRRKYVKVRTATAALHKHEKADALTLGRYIDKWKNEQEKASERIETTLENIEKHAENLEKERIAKLQAERETELAQWGVENVSTMNLGGMSAEVYEAFVYGNQKKFEERKAAEAKAEEERIERERIEKLQAERKQALLELGAKINEDKIELTCEDFIDTSNTLPVAELGSLDEKQWGGYLEEYKSTASENEKHRQKIKEENIRLQKEAEAREKEVAAKNQLRLERNAILKKYNYSLDSDVADLDEENFAELALGAEHFFNEEEKKRIEAEQAEAEAKERREQELKEERDRAAKLAKELQEKKDAEEKAKAEAEARAEAEASKGDAEKFKDYISALEAIKGKYSFKSKKYKALGSSVEELLNKTINWAISKQ